MKKEQTKLSRAELSALAKSCHCAVCEFLNISEISSLLKNRIEDSKELALLKLMLKSRSPFKVKDKEIRLGKDPIVSKSTVSDAAKRLDEVLHKFSNQFQVLREEEIAITIPRKKGGAQVGYYFSCLHDIDNSYLGPEKTTKLLQKTLEKWKKENDKKAVDNIFKNYICDFSAFIEERTEDFAGREFVFDAIDDFIENYESGYFFIYGDPGIGKSSIATKLVKERGYIHHFNIRAEGINKTETFLRNICSQLIVDYELPYNLLPSDISTDDRFLTKLLGEASKKTGPKEKIVIVVDALDEVDTYSSQAAGNILFLPPRLPGGVYIIATTRRMSLNLRVECHQGQLIIDHESSQNLEDIKGYLKTRAGNEEIAAYIKKQKLKKPAFIERMIKKSQGNFMYLRYVLPELEKGAYKDLDFDHLPVGLENYYEDHWNRMGMKANPLPGEKIKIIYILSEVQQAVSRKLLSDFSKENEVTIQAVLDEWEQFLHKVQVEDGKRFAIYHNSFRDFLNRKDIVQAAGVTIQGINDLIANNLWQELIGNE